MTCPHCHAPVSTDARFCPACGKAMAPTESGTSWPAASANAPDFVGREIAGRYRILQKLGEGGMGAVYRGEQISLKRPVAVKVLKPELCANQTLLRRFDAEAKVVAKLSHPNTVGIIDFGQDRDGSLFIAMEYIEGRSLREAIQKEAPFSPTRALAIALQVAASLSDAHAHSIVHRDLKPDNVMLQDRGKHKDVVRVLDFGIAKLRDDSRATQQAMTQAGDMLGTPQYMAPEQIRGDVTIDGRTDIYALGCMIYEMLTARLPFEAPSIMAMLTKHLVEQPQSPSQRRPDLQIPPQVDQLVMHAMAKEVASRPPTMEQFSDMLQAVLQTLPADPNRSAGMPVPYAAMSTPNTPVPAMQTPASFTPSSPPPPGFAPTPGFVPTPGFAPSAPPPAFSAPTPPQQYVPPPIPPTAAIPPRAAKSNRMTIYILLGVLAAGGAGVGVWAATHDTNKATTPEPTQPDQPEEKQDKADQPEQPPPTKADPWAPQDQGAGLDELRPPTTAKAPPPTPAPKPASKPRPTALSSAAIPKGVRIKAPAGFTASGDDTAKIYIDASHNRMIGVSALPAGSVDGIAEQWTQATGFVKQGAMKIPSAGKSRDAIVFSKELPDGSSMGQIAVLYIDSRYRVVVIYQAPTTTFADKAFQQELATFFARDVIMP